MSEARTGVERMIRLHADRMGQQSQGLRKTLGRTGEHVPSPAATPEWGASMFRKQERDEGAAGQDGFGRRNRQYNDE